MSNTLAGAAASTDEELLRDDGELCLARRRDRGTGRSWLVLRTTAARALPAVRRRLQHEWALRECLDAAWATVPSTIDVVAEQAALVLHDPGGQLLERLLGWPWDIARALRVGQSVALCLRELHTRGWFHNDLHPGHVLVADDGARAWLTGFGLACSHPRMRQAPVSASVPSAVLAHASPERTGWVRRQVDARSDLYALGTLLYQMLTGRLPFESSSPMELIHAHLARPAPAPSRHQPGVPPALDRLVLKLLAKAPEERYQSAAGIEADLRHCLEHWQARGTIEPFELAARDRCGELLIGERLYGREREQAALRASQHRVAGSGRSELVLVSGYSGIGKSSLVAELQRAGAAAGGLCATGKADRTQQGTPFATLAQALHALVQGLADRPADEADAWRSRLQQAAGSSGQVLVDLVPGLERLIGPQPPLPALSPRDTQARLHRVFRCLLQALATPRQPLLLFLDDLQWIDAATLDLLTSLFGAEPVQHLLLIGAYRNNEVGPTHVLSHWIAALRQGGTAVRDIVLSPLSPQDTARLVGDALQSSPAAIAELARLAQAATDGSPFLVAQWLATLHEEGLLAFERDIAAWTWDLERIGAQAGRDGAIELLAARLTRLPSSARSLLRCLACLGTGAGVSTLALACRRDPADIDLQLWPAVAAGLVLRLAGGYRFAHDRVQEAAYALIPPRARPSSHLRMARRLEAGLVPGHTGVSVFEVANQFNLAGPRLRSQAEADRVAALNLQAARQALTSAAHESALGYSQAALARLGPTGFRRQRALAFSVGIAHAECEFLLGRLDNARAELEALLRHATTAAERGAACRQLVALHVVRSDYAQAVHEALQGLRGLGIVLDPHPARAHVDAECAQVMALLDACPADALRRLPLAREAEVQAGMIVLGEMFAPACFTDEGLALLHLCRMVRLTLDHGLTPASTHGLAWFGIMIGHHFGRHVEGLRLAELAHALVRQHGFAACEAKTLFALEIAAVWAQPLAQAIATSRATWHTGSERGDLAVACFACNHTVNDMLVRGDHLDDVAREIEDGLAFVTRAQFRDVVDEMRTQRGFVAALRGTGSRLDRLDGADFDEAGFEAQLTADRMPTMTFWYWVFKGQLRFIAGDPGAALQALEQARAWLWSSPVHIQLLNYHLFSALALAAAAGADTTALPATRAAPLRGHLGQLRRWRASMPQTFADKVALVEAEMARLEGRDFEAARGYETAIALAREQGFVQIEALANELAWQFHAARGLPAAAAAYLRNARYAWLRWGAAGKVAGLDACHPWLQDEASVPRPSRSPAPELLDLAALIKVSTAITAETDPDRLIRTLLALALEHAGAERAVLLLQHDDELRVEAQAASVGQRIEVEHRGSRPSAELLPLSVLRQAMRSRRSVLLDDAATATACADDPYVLQRRPRSVMCLPLVRPEGLGGALYLENNLSPRAFPPERMAVLELLASQAAIALEHARLYARLLRENHERRVAESESARARAALQESEGRFRRMADASPDVIWITDLSPERVLYASPSFERIWGRRVQELYDDPRLWIEHIHEADRERIHAGFGQWLVQASGDAEIPWEAEFRVVQPGGTVRWIHERGFVITDPQGRPQRVSGISSDITERRRAAMALRESEQRFALAVAGSSDGIWDWNLLDDQVFLSERAQRLYGLEPGEPTRPRPQWRALVRLHPEDAERHGRMMADHLAQRVPVYDGEWRVLHPDGQYRWVRTRGLCVRDAEGRATRMAGSVSDVDAQRRTEAALRQAQRLEAVGTLAGGIAHDFNNILGAILGFGESALRHTRAGSRLRRDLDCIVSAGERGRALTERILAFSRSGVAERVPVHVEQEVREALRLLAGSLPPLVRVETALRSGTAAMQGDPTQVHQVLMNLATNAIQAMPQGGRLSVALEALALAAPRTATTGLLQPGEYIALSVSDSGCGIPVEIRPRIFDPFFTTKDVGTGTGLGLSLVHGIVAELGGAVDVATEVGTGSTFTVYLPRSGNAGRRRQVTADRPAPGARQRIMVVDDEAALVQLTMEALSELGYEPRGFTSGVDALGAFQADPQGYELLITDERMPHLSGTALIQAVRRLRPAMRILLVSGYATEAAAAGADAVLGKPLARQALAAALARMLLHAPPATPPAHGARPPRS